MNNFRSDFSRFLEIDENKNKPIPELKKVSTMLSSRCVNIDSRDRNRDQFPNSNKFTVHVNPGPDFIGAGLYTNLKNIYSIRLVEAVVPAAIQSYAYVTLVIPELEDTMIGTNDTLKKSFAILFPNRTHGNFISCRVKDMCSCFKKFDPPKANLRRMTLEFYTPDGELMDFGTDNVSSSPPNDNVQVMLVLEVTVEDPNRASLNSRPIF